MANRPNKPNQYIKDFLDTQYAGFATYRTAQRLPNIVDSLGQTQRKILFTLEQFPETKKLKTTETYSAVYNKTKYLHGDVSVYNVVENLARGSNNNLNLLTEEGSFGYRTNTRASSPRYTSTRFSKVARLIFKKEDQFILHKQEFEGKEIEPKFLLPILPVGLLNGFLGIGVGFSSKFLPRDPTTLIDEMIRMLTYKKKHPLDKKFVKFTSKILIPTFPYYEGDIIHNTDHDNPSAWLLTGRIRRTKTRNTIEIYEVPPEYSRESYLKKLKSLLDKGIIKDFAEECRKNSFFFKVKLPPEMGKLSDDELLQTLNLIDSFIENLTFIDPSDSSSKAIRKFNTAEEYLKVFMEIRQDFYTIRRDYAINALKKEIDILHERIRFIKAVNNQEIIILKRKKIDIEKELKVLKYNVIDSSYDYLLGMRMHALTDENIRRFTKFIKDKEAELKTLISITIEDMHINELKDLKKEIPQELKLKGLVK